jgi:curved DNA-binding protein
VASGGRENPYDVLGVPKEADADAIRKSYRKLARQFHPDVNPDDVAAEERFKQISEAYAILSDEEKKRNYDEFGDVSLEGGFDADAARRAREAFGARFGEDRGTAGFVGFGGGRIRLPRKGAPGLGGGPPGDLWATIRVRAHPVFRREGRDLFLDVPLSVAEATGGARVEVPTLDGRASVTVPPGTDSGQRLRLRGKGIADPAGGAPGDLYVVVQVRVPRDLDAEALEQLESLAAQDGAELRAGLFR